MRYVANEIVTLFKRTSFTRCEADSPIIYIQPDTVGVVVDCFPAYSMYKILFVTGEAVFVYDHELQ